MMKTWGAHRRLAFYIKWILFIIIGSRLLNLVILSCPRIAHVPIKVGNSRKHPDDDVMPLSNQEQSAAPQRYTFSLQNSEKTATGPNTLLTLVTTFSSLKERKTIERNTVRNWAALKPFVQPFVLADLKSISAKIAKRYGWIVKDSNLLGPVSSVGLPYINDLLDIVCKDSTNSSFVGFANGDLLFTRSLIKTLQFLNRQKMVKSQNILMIGQRKDLDKFASALVNINGTHLTDITWLNFMDYYSAGHDIFLFNKCYNWNLLPNFVVGHPKYDMYLPVVAALKNFTVINLSKTVEMAHQFSQPHWASFQEKDQLANLDILEKDYNVRELLSKKSQGIFNASLWVTAINDQKLLQLVRHDNSSDQPVSRWFNLRREAIQIWTHGQRIKF